MKLNVTFKTNNNKMNTSFGSIYQVGSSISFEEIKAYIDEYLNNLFADPTVTYIFDGGDSDVVLAILDETILI
jgi:hypothetical protein